MPGLEDVRSVISRGSAEINLFFNWTVDMLETLQLVDAAVSRVQSSLPATAQIRTHRLDFSSFPIIGYSLTSDTVPQKDLWELATYEIKPRLNRLPGVASVLVQGGQRPEFHVIVDPAADAAGEDVSRRHPERRQPHQHHRLARIPQPATISCSSASSPPRCTAPEEIGDIVVKHVNNVPVHVQDVGTVVRRPSSRSTHRSAPMANQPCC